MRLILTYVPSLSYGSASPYEVTDGGAGIPSAALVYDLSSLGRGDSVWLPRTRD
jgi:hypothetical protein